MAGWTGPVARALDSFDPWKGAPPAFGSTKEERDADRMMARILSRQTAVDPVYAAIDRRIREYGERLHELNNAPMPVSSLNYGLVWPDQGALYDAAVADIEAEGEALVARMNLEGGRA